MRPIARQELATFCLVCVTLAVILLQFGGCSDPEPVLLPPTPDLQAVDLLVEPEGELLYDQWYVHKLGSHKIGHRRYREFRVGADLHRIALDELTLPRFGGTSHQVLRAADLLQFDSGNVRQLQYAVSGSGASRSLTGRVVEQQLFLSRAAGGETAESQPWHSKNGGLFAVERALLTPPIQRGESRAVVTWDALIDVERQFQLTAIDWQQTEVAGVDERLLRVEATLAGAADVDSIYWVDPSGRLRKVYHAALEQTSFATTRSGALAPNSEPEFDLAIAQSVPVTLPVGIADQTQRVEYEVTTPDRDPAGLFATCAYQSVQTSGTHSVRIVVAMPSLEVQGADSPSLEMRDVAPTAADVRPNRWIDSGNRVIQDLARRISGDRPGTVEALCDQATLAVHRELEQAILDQGFLTASQALQARSGDCTEHAMLLAAVLRAQSVPARVAIGLILDRESSRFQFHMWTEAWNGANWRPLDATDPEIVPHALRLKLAHTNLDTSSDWAIVAPVVKLGTAKIRIMAHAPP